MTNIKALTNTARALALDTIENAKSGHPGMALSAAPLLTTLYARHININPGDDKWQQRDRFVMSAGHGSALLYSVLHLITGAVTLDDLKSFRRFGSRTPGHPEVDITPFIDCSTGPLGQGLANAVGMAIAAKNLGGNNKIYCLVGDGCLMEGVGMEAMDLAGTLALNNLIVLFDSNDATLDGPVKLARTANIAKIYDAVGFFVQQVDGENEDEIDKALARAKDEKGRPSIIIAKTKIGFASRYEGSSKSHGKAFNEQEVLEVKNKLGLSGEKFFVSKEVQKYCKEIAAQKQKNCSKLKADKLTASFAKIVIDIKDFIGKDMPTREAGGKALNIVAQQLPSLIGGNADVAASTRQTIDGSGYILANNYGERNIHFGVREHAMGAIANGIALYSGRHAFCSTFFAFENYMTASIRMAALMNLPVVFVFTTDSIGAGEDGPSHQPVEQLAALRAMPNLSVFRPCDAAETALCYEAAFNRIGGPSVIILTRQKLKALDCTSREGVSAGAYVAYKPKGTVKGYFITSGSETALCIEAAKELSGFAVINMVCAQNFDALAQKEQNKILNPKIAARIICEAAHENALIKYRGLAGKSVCVNSFGYSGSFADVYKAFGVVKENLVKVAKNLKN